MATASLPSSTTTDDVDYNATRPTTSISESSINSTDSSTENSSFSTLDSIHDMLSNSSADGFGDAGNSWDFLAESMQDDQHVDEQENRQVNEELSVQINKTVNEHVNRLTNGQTSEENAQANTLVKQDWKEMELKHFNETLQKIYRFMYLAEFIASNFSTDDLTPPLKRKVVELQALNSGSASVDSDSDSGSSNVEPTNSRSVNAGANNSEPNNSRSTNSGLINSEGVYSESQRGIGTLEKSVENSSQGRTNITSKMSHRKVAEREMAPNGFSFLIGQWNNEGRTKGKQRAGRKYSFFFLSLQCLLHILCECSM